MVGEQQAIGRQGHLTQLSVQEAPELRLLRQARDGRAVGTVPGALARWDRTRDLCEEHSGQVRCIRTPCGERGYGALPPPRPCRLRRP
jgi:hypothetical protein